MMSRRRQTIGCTLLAIAGIGLSTASFAIAFPMPDPATPDGRHRLAGALANLALSAVMTMIALFPLRAKERWAFFAYTAPLLTYGFPILLIDANHVSRANLWATLAPQAAGLAIALTGLLLVAPSVFGSRQDR